MSTTTHYLRPRRNSEEAVVEYEGTSRRFAKMCKGLEIKEGICKQDPVFLCFGKLLQMNKNPIFNTFFLPFSSL